MKKILVASSLPYSQSNRGIDIITEALIDMNMNVTHLTFPSKEAFLKDNKNFTQLGIKGRKIAYYERIMKNFPKNITQYFINQTIKPLKNFNFSDYDYIILESGKPIFLIDLIPDKVPIIYRQSDSVKYILSRNKLFQSYEEKIIDKAYKIIVVREIFKNLLNDKYKEKTFVIPNGFNIPDDYEDYNPFRTNNNIIYLGYTTIDFKTVYYICKNNPEIHIHIIGRPLVKKQINKLKRKFSNFHYYGTMNAIQYNKYLKYSDLAIVPYKKDKKLEFIGLNSKYLNFMYFKLPIVSYKVGQLDEFNGSKVFFVENKREFSIKIKENIGKKIDYSESIDFKSLSKKELIKKYQSLFLEIFC